MILYIWLISALAALVMFFRQVYSRFRRYGVKHLTPIPPLGTLWRTVLRIEHVGEDTVRIYHEFPSERFAGKYEFLKPIVVIRDLDLIKRITVKDFEYFVDHRTVLSEKNDPLFGRNLFCLKGQEWKNMRATLSPAFTSSKMKMMVPFMLEVGDQMIIALKNQINCSKSKCLDLDARDLTTRFANDVIASCAFGLKVDSHNDRDNQFYLLGSSAATFDFTQIIKVFMYCSFPGIMEKLKVCVFSAETTEFFKTLFMNSMKDREANHIVRHDLVHMLMEAKKGKLYHDDINTKSDDAGFAAVEESSVGKQEIKRNWTDIDLIAQAMVFFNAGLETVSSTAAFLLHELALHPDVQDRLYQEILNMDRKTGGKIDYNVIQEMTYMDMVVSEVLRMWPSSITLDRSGVIDYSIGKPNANSTADYIVHKGDIIQIPVAAIHRDPKYFPDPNKFDPERFSEGNKHKVPPFAYMPFGIGPRNCIGSRFALCEVKVMTYQLLRAMEVAPCERTQLKARLDPSSFVPRIHGGHWLRFRQRD